MPVAAVLALRRHPAAGPLARVRWSGWRSPPSLPSRCPGGTWAWSPVRWCRWSAWASCSAWPASPWCAGPAGGRRSSRGPAAARWWARAPALATGAVLAAGVVLATRPWWLVVRQSPNDPGSRVVAGLQRLQGLPVDGGRTYAEHTVHVGRVVHRAARARPGLAGAGGAGRRADPVVAGRRAAARLVGPVRRRAGLHGGWHPVAARGSPRTIPGRTAGWCRWCCRRW